jgi:poly(A) polymerase
MPIITPAYPSMCATHNITHSTKAIIIRELTRCKDLSHAIAAGKKTWKDLFEKHTFFTEGYKYYLSIVAASRTKEAQQIWSGLVQSKVRRLVSGIEMSDTGVELAHPFNKGFDRVHRCKNNDEVDMVFQGDLRFQVFEENSEVSNSDDIVMATEMTTSSIGNATGSTETANGETGPITVYTTTYYVGLELGGADGMSSIQLLVSVLTNII